MHAFRGSRWASSLSGNIPVSSSSNTARQLGSMPTRGVPARISASRRGSGGDTLRQVQEAVVIERASAADVPFGDHDLPAGGLDRLHAGDPDICMKVIVEGIRPHHDTR